MPNEFDESGFEMPPKPVWFGDYLKPEHYDIDKFEPRQSPMGRVVSSILLLILAAGFVAWFVALRNP